LTKGVFDISSIPQTSYNSPTKGGGGWRKTFKNSNIQIRIFLLKSEQSALSNLPSALDVLKALQKKEDLSPDKTKPFAR